MRVAYFDLGFSSEEYGLFPTKYGGGAVVARYMKEMEDIDFYVFAPTEAFDNVGPTERRDRCIGLSADICSALQRGFSFNSILKDHFDPFDLVLHPHTCFGLHRWDYRGPIVHFAGFDGACGHPMNDFVLLYDPSFTPQFGERAKYVKIGKPVPPVYPGYEGRKPFVFQCSRFDGDHLGGVGLAKQCLAEGFRGVFAGPIRNGYPLMDYIDGKTTVYLGEIGEVEKLDYCRNASLFGLLPQWPKLPYNQSIIEAQGQGTPIYTYPIGPFLSTYLHHGRNGFDAREISLWGAYTAADKDMSYASWAAAKEYGVDIMCESFKRVFREIVTEWAAR